MKLTTNDLTDTLDRIETRLPLIPRRVLRLQRSVLGAGMSVGRSIFSALASSSDRVGSSARSGIKTVAGQARAEAEQTSDVTKTEASSALGRAARAFDGDSTERLEQWTKADLYERAQELGIDGRSKMSKGELVSALRSV
jgi:hypothetical protein